MKNILFIVPFPKKISPSARFRIEMYEDILRANGFSCDYNYFWNQKTTEVLYKPGYLLKKVFGAITGFARRFKTLFTINKYDYIFILRETTPLGPPIFEWIYAKIFKKKIVYDFDDAIWVNQAEGTNAWAKFVKSFWKVKKICKWSHVVSVGNRYLYNYALQYNSKLILNPTCVDTDNKHNTLKQQFTERVAIGWTGSFSQLKCLNEVIDVLQTLELKYDFDFILVANKDPKLKLKNYTFIRWNEETEIDDLLKMNIGIMPLPDDEFSRGKCGFKIIQFMSLGIPVVATPVEVNKLIVDDNVNGYLCSSHSEWYTALETLLMNEDLRNKAGLMGRKKIVEKYSRYSNAQNFLDLFK